MATIDLTNLPKQTNDIYLPLYKNQSRYMLMYGGAGSGKSVFAVQKLLKRILVERNHKVWVLRKVARTSRESTFALFKNIIHSWGIGYHTRIKEGDIHINFPSFNSSIIFGGADDVEKVKSIAGITIIWMEELTEYTEKDFNQIDLRLRGKTEYYKQIIGTFNPDLSKGAWIKRRFFDKVNEKATVLHSVASHNKHIDEEYLNILDGIEDETYRKIYKLGLWALSKGIIYQPFKRIKECDIPIHGVEKIYGLDFGYNHQTALTEITVKDKQVYIKELLYETHLTNNDLIEKMKTLIFDKRCVIYCDAAEPDRIEEISRAGFNAYPAYKVAGSVKNGIDFVKSIHSNIFVSEYSANFFTESGIYKWLELKDGTITDKPVDYMDHLMDSFRYAIYTHYREIWHTHNIKASVFEATYTHRMEV